MLICWSHCMLMLIMLITLQVNVIYVNHCKLMLIMLITLHVNVNYVDHCKLMLICWSYCKLMLICWSYCKLMLICWSYCKLMLICWSHCKLMLIMLITLHANCINTVFSQAQTLMKPGSGGARVEAWPSPGCSVCPWTLCQRTSPMECLGTGYVSEPAWRTSILWTLTNLLHSTPLVASRVIFVLSRKWSFFLFSTRRFLIGSRSGLREEFYFTAPLGVARLWWRECLLMSVLKLVKRLPFSCGKEPIVWASGWENLRDNSDCCLTRY